MPVHRAPPARYIARTAALRNTVSTLSVWSLCDFGELSVSAYRYLLIQIWQIPTVTSSINIITVHTERLRVAEATHSVSGHVFIVYYFRISLSVSPPPSLSFPPSLLPLALSTPHRLPC